MSDTNSPFPPPPPKVISFEIPYPIPPGVEGLMLAHMVFERMPHEERGAAVNWLIDYYGLPVRRTEK